MSKPVRVGPGERKDGLTRAAKAAGYSAALFFGVHTLGAVLAGNASAAAIAQAVAAEWGGGRLGIAWNDPQADVPNGKTMAKRGLRGAAIGLAIAILIVLLLVATKSARILRGDFGVTSLLTGLAVTVCVAVRDELLLRGALLRVVSTVRSAHVKAAIGALAQVAFAIGTAEATISLAGLAVAAALGALYTYLWLVERGAFLAVGAHAAVAYATTTLATGAVADVRIAQTGWAGADGGLLGGYAAAVVVLVSVVVAARAISRRVP